MNEHDQKEFFQQAVNHRLSGLREDPFLARRIIASEKGAQPIMKKKLSLSLVFAIVLTLLTLSVGYALVQSHIADRLFSGGEAPQEVLDHILMPNAAASSDVAGLSIDELLYDGSALHASFTISNPTDEALLYTVDGLWLNGVPLSRSTLTAEGAGSYGLLLGGTVDGAALPASASVYNESDGLYQFSDSGRFLGFAPVPEGPATLRLSVAVWQPINTPRLVDYSAYEGCDVTDTLDHLVASRDGSADLELFRPAEAHRSYTALERGSEAYAEVYRELGWAQLLDTIDVEVEVDLSREQLTHAVPVQTAYRLNDELTLTITGFELSHAGGYMDGWLSGPDEAIGAYLGNGLCLVDREGNRIFNNGTTWSSRADGADGVAFRMELWPVAGEIPEYAELAPVVTYSPVWEEGTPDYDPAAEKPEDVVGAFQLDFSRAIRIEFR